MNILFIWYMFSLHSIGFHAIALFQALVTIDIWAGSLAPRLSTTHPLGGPVDFIWPRLWPPPTPLKGAGLAKGSDMIVHIVYLCIYICHLCNIHLCIYIYVYT